MSARWLIEDGRESGWYLEPHLFGSSLVWTDEPRRAAFWEDPGEAAQIAQTVTSLGYPCSVICDPRTLAAAPSDSDRPAARDEATEPGDPSGVGDLAGVGGRGTPPRQGAAERLALSPQTGDLQSSEGHSHQGPETCTSGPIPPDTTWTAEQQQLFRRCALCQWPLSARQRVVCSRRCKKERDRRKRFDQGTRRLRARRAGRGER